MIRSDTIIIPGLKIKNYKQRYEKFSEHIRMEVIYAYLFQGYSHRWIDEHILGQKDKQIKGYMAMSILHHLGIIGEHKGIFKDYTLEDAIYILTAQKNKEFAPIIEILKNKLDLYINEIQTYKVEKISEQYIPETLEELIQELDEKTKRSRRLKRSERISRLNNAAKIPQVIQVMTIAYKRNADVVAEVLERASGICERCGMDAPFVRVLDGTPYLEVHHKIRLADGGEDTIENAIAVCPNCHRELHYGI